MAIQKRPEPIPGEPWEDKVARLAKYYPPVPGYRKFWAGDRVRYSGGVGGNMKRISEGVTKAMWDMGACQEGVVVAVTRFGLRGNSAPWLVVEPDPQAGHGFFCVSGPGF